MQATHVLRLNLMQIAATSIKLKNKIKYACLNIHNIHGHIMQANILQNTSPVQTFVLIEVRWTWPFFTHWGRVTHICINKLTIVGSDNGLSPGRRQAIIWTNAGILLIGP